MNGIQQLGDAAIAIMLVAIVIALTLTILSEFTNVLDDATANATVQQLNSDVASLADWVTILILVIVAVILFANFPSLLN